METKRIEDNRTDNNAELPVVKSSHQQWMEAIREHRKELKSPTTQLLWDKISDMENQHIYYAVCVNTP